MRPDEMRAQLKSEFDEAQPAGNIGIALDRLAGQLSVLDGMIGTFIQKLDPALLPFDPKEQDVRGPEPTKDMSHAARFIDEQIDRVLSLQAAVATATRRVDL